VGGTTPAEFSACVWHARKRGKPTGKYDAQIDNVDAGFVVQRINSGSDTDTFTRASFWPALTDRNLV